MSNGFRDLEVWQHAMELVEDIYRVTVGFPADERFGVVAQLRRSAVSVPSCIAEGHARHTTREYLRFVGIAAGSLAELRTQSDIAARLGWLSAEPHHNIETRAERLSRMLTRLRQALESKVVKPSALSPIPDL
jgi:four helix bundle protein